MKSYNHLFEKLINDDNLRKALNKASLGKRDRKSVKEVLDNTDFYLAEMKNNIISGNIEFGVQDPIIIEEGFLKKKRIIICPEFKKAQWLHHAIVQTMYEVFTKGMYAFTCGSIPKRGVHYGKKYTEKFITNNQSEIKYALKLDFHHYYPSVDIDLLKERLASHIHDTKFLSVVYKVLDANKARIDGNVVELGLPIGYYTSQWFANWYLQPLDHYIKEVLGAKYYVRYMDDMVIFGKNKKKLHLDLEKIRKFAEENLHLKLKDNYQVFRFDYIDRVDGKRKGRPLDFMGFRFYRDKTTLRRSIYYKAIRTVCRIKKKAKISWFDACQIVSYLGWFYNADTYMAFKKYIEPFANIGLCKKIIKRTQKQRRHADGSKLQKCRKFS